MKNRKVLSSLGTILILSLLITSVTVILPIQDSSGAPSHSCLKLEIVPVEGGGIRVIVTGCFEVHAEENHPANHFFTCC
jgi:hypothetical protein